MVGWLQCAAAMTSASSASVSYGHRSESGAASANARLSRDSWRWHSTSSASLRPAQIGSPMPQTRSTRGLTGIQELLPGRNQTRRIAPDLVHVGELHVGGVGRQLGLEQRDLAGVHRHEHRLPGLDPGADERHRPGQEFLVARVEEGVVRERRPGSACRGAGAHAGGCSRITAQACASVTPAASRVPRGPAGCLLLPCVGIPTLRSQALGTSAAARVEGVGLA